MTIIISLMKFLFIFTYNSIFYLYKKITSDYHAANAAYTLSIGFVIILLYFLIELCTIYFFNFSFLRSINNWVFTISSLIFFIISKPFFISILKNSKNAKCSNLL